MCVCVCVVERERERERESAAGLVAQVGETCISSREDCKSASSATVETSAEADSLCDSADEENCKFY